MNQAGSGLAKERVLPDKSLNKTQWREDEGTETISMTHQGDLGPYGGEGFVKKTNQDIRSWVW